MSYVPGTADLHIQQPSNNPHFFVDVDRSKAQDIGFTQRDVAGSMLVATSGSFPDHLLPSGSIHRNGVSYNIVAQSPQYTLQSLSDLENIPITSSSAAATTVPSPYVSVGSSGLTPASAGAAPPPRAGVQPIQILGNVASLTRGTEPATISHYNIAPALDIYGNVVNSDLRSVSDKITQIVDQHRKELPRGSQVVIRGQVQTMNSSFIGLTSGLVFSILLVYLLIVVNFQSWLDPFMIVAALPAALCGIVWMLFITGTHVSVPALTGSIMTMGVATANSILVISFAREQLEINVGDARAAALSAGLHPLPPRADDCFGHDHRHGADGARFGRRRRAECATGPGGHRRIVVRHRGHAILRAYAFQRDSWPVGAPSQARRCHRCDRSGRLKHFCLGKSSCGER